MEKTALIAGVSGLVGNNLAQHLCSHGWKVFGLSRNGKHLPEEVNPVTADMLNLSQLKEALVGIEPSHVFFASWLRQKTEKQNIEVNSSMIRNLLDAVCPSGSVEHVALVTGLKHYLGPFEQYAKGTPPTPFKESQPRLDTENFYYAQEDALFEASRHYGFTWSVHRPHTLVGYAIGNAMNIGMTLAVFGAICRETGQPFHFPGSATQWNGLTDMTDARQLASHVEWAALTPAAHNQALNVINGDVFRWKWMWERLAAWFDIAAVPFSGEIFSLEQQLAECASIWADMAARDAPINLSCSRGKLQFSRHLQRHWTKSDRKIMYGELFRPVLR
ncbi:SDR family oxidoreductase, partial [Pseudomonas putida]|uniref:SDR family oxidoreductase n=1 Tax=Pseudomonas putida TaxID=303 RepID=UPI0018DA04E2